MHLISGTAEILGGIGLILPGLVKIRPELTPLAAVGLLVVMVSAIVWHVRREESTSIGGNVVSIVALSYIASGRWRPAPLAHRSRLNTL